MITITYEKFMMALALFTALCVAGGWLIKIINGIRKPSNNIRDMLDSDNKRLKELEENRLYMQRSIRILMKSNLAMLGHMTTDNNTGELAKMEQEIQDFLIHC